MAIAVADVPRETQRLEEISLDLVDVGANVRVDAGELEELAASIVELGVLQPVKVTPMANGRYRLLWGQRRVLASRQAGKTTIPAIVDIEDDQLADAGARRSIEQLAENLQRKDLNPIEEAVALREVLDADKRSSTAGLRGASLHRDHGGRMSVREIPLDIIVTGRNVRDKTDAGLVDSIRRHGVLQPITVRAKGKRFEVLMGHRRLQAVRELGLDTIPAIIDGQEHDDLILRQVAENVHRKAMNPMEVARALEAYLVAHPDMTKRELGEAMGYSGQTAATFVSNKLALLRLPDEIQERIERRELAEHLAIKQRARLGDGRGRPQVISEPDEDGRSRSIGLELGRTPGGRPGRVTIGVDHVGRQADLVVEVGELRLYLTLEPREAKLLGRRLTQAWEAIA
jgi:ParB/RepB/Spo0J family partition protein